MKPEDAQRDRKALEIFGRAIEVAGAEARAACLEEACGGDAALQARVEALLANHVEDSFLQNSAADLRPTIKLNLAPKEAPAQMLGRYKLLEQIGEGGFGEVWMAEQREPVKRRVALKLIKLGMDSRQIVARFEAERQALAMMDHANIAKIFDAGVTDSGRPYFVMELVRGIKITEYCDQNQLPTRERLRLFILVCQAIQHAHQKGIIHRDIKPSNILVTLHDGVPVPKVIDFGIAKATQGELTDKTVFTQFQQFIGTPAYISPEQAEMSGLDIDTRADIYSLGVLLYELLVGQTPFDAKEMMQGGLDALRRIIREREPQRPSTKLNTLVGEARTTAGKRRQTEVGKLVHQVQGDLDWIVMKCLEKDRTRRYETANGLAADIQRHLANEPVVACPPSAAYKFQKAWQRNKLAFAAGTVVTAALVISLGGSILALRKAQADRERMVAAEKEQRRERTNAEQARETATQERDRSARLLSVSQAKHGVELLENSDPVGLLHLLEARKTVEHLREDRIRRTLLWSGWMNSLPKAEMKVLEMPGYSGDWAQLVANPLAQSLGRPWMATGTTNGEVILWDAKTGQTITTFTTGKRRVGSPDLSADGRLLMVNADGLFQLWDLAPVRSNQPPLRLLGKILRYAFDGKHRRVVTYADQGLPERGEPNTNLPIPVSQVQIWDSNVEPSLVSPWDGDRSELANHQFALSTDGLKVVTGWESLKVWDAKTGRQIEPTLRVGGTGNLRRLTDQLFQSPDGRWLWEIMAGTCQRYDLSTGQPAGDPIGNLHRWSRPWVSPSGQHLILSLVNGFQVIDLDAGGSMGPLIARDDDALRALALSSDGGKLAIAGPDREVRVWDTRTGQQFGRTLMPPTRVGSATFTPDGNWLSLAGGDGRSRTHSLTPQPSTWIKEWAGMKVFGFNQQGELLTYEIKKRTMEWRHPDTDQVSLAWPVPDGGALIGSALSPDGARVAASIQTGKLQSLIRLWDTATGKLLEPAIAWTNVGALAFSPDGRTLSGLSGGDGSGSIQLWDVATRQPQSFLASPPMEVSWLALRYSPDGRFIAARNSYVTYVWDVVERRLASGAKMDLYLAISEDWTRALTEDLLDFTDPRRPRPAPNPISSRGTPTKRGGLALSPDGRLRVAETGNKSVRLWDNITGRPVGQEMKLTHMLRHAEFSPDSRLLVGFEWNLGPSGPGPKMSIRLWDTSTGLPCGPAVPLAEMPIDFLFDREMRFLAVTAPFETTTSVLLALPEREIPLAEMERQSWLLAGSRLDESGNAEILSGEEILQLEASTSLESPPAKAQSVKVPESSAPISRAEKPTVPQPTPTTLPTEIKVFIAAKEQQARSLARKLNSELRSDVADFFRAAQAGRWQQASNSFAGASRRLYNGPPVENSAALQAIRQPMIETHIALEYYTQAQPKYATAFGRDIIASIPSGSIYFGGTDPGRGLVTALCQSHAEGDPFFTITQNHLADASYLDYVRQMHGQSIYVPTPPDSQAAFQAYLSDAQRRLEHDQKFPNEPRQIKPGESIQRVENRVQVSGQVAVMGINALLARTFFDKNPRLEFYVEESFPLNWMYPHLEPHGLIMKLNRAPLDQISPRAVKRDQEFWSGYMKPLLGDWLKEDTTVSEVCAFIERVFVRKDLKGFAGDPAFVGDPYACKAFSKLRSSIAGVYSWREVNTKDETVRKRMNRAADFAFRQALALCPYSPEVVSRYARALADDDRMVDALRVAQVAVKFPETQAQAEQLIQELSARKKQ